MKRLGNGRPIRLQAAQYLNRVETPGCLTQLPNGNLGSLRLYNGSTDNFTYQETAQDGHELLAILFWDSGADYCDDVRRITWFDQDESVHECRVDHRGRHHGFDLRWTAKGPRRVHFLMVRGHHCGFDPISGGYFFGGRDWTKKEYAKRLPRAEQLAKVLPISIAKRVVTFL